MSLREGDPQDIGGYPLEARLGSGGMGTVYLARTASGRPVAIKLIHQQFAADDEFRTRFRQEVAAARRVSGAFTAAVVDADTEGVHPWMATTYIEGPTLAQRIARRGPVGGAELRGLAIGLTEALRDIHRADVVHRDLKPSNVVLSPEGPRVIDFGISRAADQQTLTMTGRVIGTPPFMSPEQLQAPRGVGPASDVFSLGTLLVYAATGQGPFDADSPYMTAYQVVHEAPELGEVPEVLRAVVEPCLAKTPETRPSADGLLEQLRDLPTDLGGAGAGAAAAGSGVRRTRDMDTEHSGPPSHGQGNPPAAPAPAPAPAPASALAPAPAPASERTLIRQRLRKRWRPVLAAAVAVAAIGGGIAVLTAGGDGSGARVSKDSGRDGKGRTLAAAEQPLPGDFKPWHHTVRGGSVPDELRCVARDDSVFCGGGGVVGTRLRAADGSRVWTVKSPGVPVNGLHLVGVTSDTVLGYRIPAEGGEEVVALDAEKGDELWSAPSGAQSAAVAGGRSQDAVVAGSTVLTVDGSRTHIEARQAHSGKLRWRAPFPAGSECTPVAAGKRAYAMCAPVGETDSTAVRHPSLHPLGLSSGELGRTIALKGQLQPLGTADDGSFVLVRQRVKGPELMGYDAVVRVDPKSGSATYKPLKKTYPGTPGLADGTVYVTAQTGQVSAFDPASGALKWSRQSGIEGASGPVAADGVLYVSSASGRVAALAERGGARLWTTDPRTDGLTGESNASGRVAVAGRVVVVAADKNVVFAFDAVRPPESG
ncbi:PQQ-binding-like beta-propeller repeat protein [Streptomyces sp. NPDC059009]|uniref:protein kinase domain-containing protein n=1 Tax=Streptomyces sp. NPDC059009 TaxID=3346694 RepID=UPI00369B6AD7